MKVKFIRHSCYSLETENYYLVFDYIGGPLNIPVNKKIVFFVSHGHKDHFSEDIFDFNADLYVISDDVTITKNNSNILFLSKDKEINILGLRIKTTDSTDLGVAFFIEADGKGIIHLGDNNYWIWPHYTKEDILNMDRWFKGEINKLKEEKVDIVFMPVDPRLEENFYLTADYVLKTIDAKDYFPMHMWEKYNISLALKEKYKHYTNKNIYVISKEGDEFEI